MVELTKLDLISWGMSTDVLIQTRFENLTNSPLPGVRFGPLEQIWDAQTNMVVSDFGFSPAAQRVLRDLNVMDASEPYAHGDTSRFVVRSEHRVKQNDFYEAAKNLLAWLIPPTSAAGLVYSELSHMFGLLSDAHRGRAGCSGDLCFTTIVGPRGACGTTHADTDTEHRALITLPTKEALSTWIMDDRVLTSPMPARARMDGVRSINGRNSFGSPTAGFEHLVRQAPVGRVLLWKGWATETPRAHSEPDVLTAEQARVTLIVEPTEMLARSHNRQPRLAR